MPNAFSVVTPMVTDSFVATSGATKFKNLTDWGMSSHRILKFIEEGIQKLADGPFWFYIPDFNWEAVCVNLGNSPMYSHLLPERTIAEDGASTSKDSVLIGDILCATLDIAREYLSPDVPLTVYGLDSLSAARLSFALKPLFSISHTQLLANVTLRSLEARLEDQRLPALVEAEQRSVSELHQVSEMRSLVAKYTSGFKSPKTLLPSSLARDCVVLITGTTGVPGTPAMLERHQQIFHVLSLNPAGLEIDKVVYLEGILDKDYFGLSTDTFNEMARSVTHIIHIAWPVDFAVPLAAFDHAIHGLRNLVDFAISSPWQVPPRLLFTSTVGVLSGQLTGRRNGYWKTTEWMPSMIRSGLFVGALPNRSNTVNWLPVDVAAESMVEMFDSPPGVYHLTHPSPEAACIMNVPLVPYTQWFASLEKQASSQTPKSLQTNPALRLLYFFRYTTSRRNPTTNTENFLEPELSCAKALQESSTLRSMISSPLGARDVAKWMGYWRSVGFIPA
ncbi:hypothetical protein BDR05DRAFT_977232 [Suillus weaverae]|nr:hypothetical protein BDR05DRAFT_977232 [Suillus weaverae]